MAHRLWRLGPWSQTTWPQQPSNRSSVKKPFWLPLQTLSHSCSVVQSKSDLPSKLSLHHSGWRATTTPSTGLRKSCVPGCWAFYGGHGVLWSMHQFLQGDWFFWGRHFCSAPSQWVWEHSHSIRSWTTHTWPTGKFISSSKQSHIQMACCHGALSQSFLSAGEP